MINIECKMNYFLEEFEKDIKKTIKDSYITIIEKEVKKELDKTRLNKNEKEIKVNEITKEIFDSLQIKKDEIEDFMKKLNREIKIKIDENKN